MNNFDMIVISEEKENILVVMKTSEPPFDYLAEIEASRANDAEPVVPLNEPTPSSSDYSDLDECDGEDSWFEDDFDEEEDTE